MSTSLQSSPNRLLAALSPAERALLAPHAVQVPLTHRQLLVVADAPVAHVYFPEDGITSIVSNLPETGPTKVGIVGREGMVGTSLLLGVDRSPHDTFVQVEGASAQRLESGRLREAIAASPTLHATLLRFVQALMVQTAHSAVSNAHHRVEARLARWLLMCHDRIDGDEFPITHEFMSMMIAAQRSGVTVTLHILEGAGLIRARRGRIAIVNRERLEDIAGDAYGRPEEEYRRLIGPFGKGPGPRP